MGVEKLERYIVEFEKSADGFDDREESTRRDEIDNDRLTSGFNDWTL